MQAHTGINMHTAVAFFLWASREDTDNLWNYKLSIKIHVMLHVTSKISETRFKNMVYELLIIVDLFWQQFIEISCLVQYYIFIINYIIYTLHFDLILTQIL